MSSATQAGVAPASTLVPSEVLQRVRAEFLEMPGLRLTRAQARRLWALDADTCDAVLSTLEGSGFLRRTREGKYMLAFPTA
jgi:hypothetical protein